MPTVLPMTRVEAYLAYKAGVIAESDLKPSLKTNFYSGLENWLAYWCGLTADYPKDENNDPKWYTEEEYYVAYLCGIAPDYPVNCYRRVGAYLRYIISARWDRPEKPLTREEYYLSLMDTSYLPPNDPASIITLDNTAEAPFKDLKIYGDTKQTTYTGKNVMSLATADFNNDNRFYRFTPNFPAGTYTISFDLESFTMGTNESFPLTLRLYNDTTTIHNSSFITITPQTTLGRKHATFTISSAADGSNSNINETTTDYNNGARAKISNIQIESGSTATNYEPYVGGLPSPNPDYPQDIQVVTGEQTVKVTGKNICSGTKISGGNHQVWFKLPKLTSGNIVLSTILNESLSGNTLALVIGEQSQGTLGSITATAGTRFSFSCSLSEQQIQAVNNTSDAWLRIYNSTANFTTPTDPMIEYGSTATTYEPYQSQTYKVNLGKNLFDKSNVEAGKRLDSSGGLYSDQNYFTTQYIEVTPNIKYAYSRSATGGGSSAICYYKSDKTFISRTMPLIAQSDTSGVFTPPSEARYVRICELNTLIDSVQFEAGSTATTYAPYFPPIELCKIGTYQDYIWKDGADWKVHKAVGKAVYDGSETWGVFSNGKAFYHNEANALILTDSTLVSPMLSDYYTVDIYTRVYNGNIDYGTSLSLGGANHRILIRNKDCADVAALKAWLASYNATFYFALSTPTDTVITDASLISQLDALLEGGSYAPQTNITLTTAEPNLPGLLQVTAAKWQ